MTADSVSSNAARGGRGLWPLRRAPVFANAEDFRRRALAAADGSDGSAAIRWSVLNAEANVEVDLTALDALEQLQEELCSRGIVFAIARVKQDLRDVLAAAGLIDRIGTNRLYPTLPTAVDAYRREKPGPSTG